MNSNSVKWLLSLFGHFDTLVSHLLYRWLQTSPGDEVDAETWKASLGELREYQVTRGHGLGLAISSAAVLLLLSAMMYYMGVRATLSAYWGLPVFAFLAMIISIDCLKGRITKKERCGATSITYIPSRCMTEFVKAMTFLRESSVMRNGDQHLLWKKCSISDLRIASILELTAWAQKIKILEPDVCGMSNVHAQERKEFGAELRRQVRLLGVPRDPGLYFYPNIPTSIPEPEFA